MSPDHQPDIDPAFADAVRRAYVRPVDEATAERHVSAIVATAAAGEETLARRPSPSLPRRRWWPALAAGATTVLLPVGLALAGVSLPKAVDEPYRALGIALPHQAPSSPTRAASPSPPLATGGPARHVGHHHPGATHAHRHPARRHGVPIPSAGAQAPAPAPASSAGPQAPARAPAAPPVTRTRHPAASRHKPAIRTPAPKQHHAPRAPAKAHPIRPAPHDGAARPATPPSRDPTVPHGRGSPQR
ncbi:MAG: hypothetical protein QOF77_1543 [Solirubrobacteraceae bacterium]|nr:hypothetical protein [Solirubrobacteraceae bacterium]